MALVWSALRFRLLALIALVFLPALGLMVWTGVEDRRTTAIRIQESLGRLAREIAFEQQAVIEGAHQLLVALADVPAVRAADPTACPAMLADLRQRFPRYGNLGVADADGEVVCSAQRLGARVNVRDRSYFRRALEANALAVSDYQIGRIIGRPVVTFAHPLPGAGDRPAGVVFAALDLAWLEERAARLGLPAGSTLTVIDPQGTVLVRTPNGGPWVGRVVADTELVRVVRERRAGVAEGPELDGTRALYAFAPFGSSDLPGTPTLVIGLPTRVAFAELHRKLLVLGLGLALTGLAAVGGGWLAGDRLIGRRVRRLVEVARRLGQGDLDARVGPPHGGGELGELGRAFDEAAASIQRLTGRNRLLLDSMGEGMYGLDRQGRVTFINPAAARLTGWDPGELLGQSMHARIHHSRADGSPYPPEACPSAETLQRGTVKVVRDEVFWRRDGTCFPVEYVAAPIREDGAVVGAVITFRDVTKERQIEEELQRQREALHQSEKVATLGSLLAGVAHELNNPLSVVTGQAALLKMKAPDPAVAQRAEKIAAAADRCVRTVRNFLALARKRAPERAQVDVNQVVRDAVDLLAYQFRTDAVDLQLDLAGDLPRPWGDPHRLYQVIVNLMTNAQHALRGQVGPRRLTVVTRAVAGGRRVRIEVADTGPGIPAELRDRIFEPFFTTKPVGEGTGLGLPLCLSTVEEHGGTLTLESEPGQGATFIIELPVEPRAERAPTAEPEAAPEVPPARILVVDDETEVAAILAELLEGDGHRVDVAGNGAEALDRLAVETYDAILCDSKMPVLDGIRLYLEMERRFPHLRRRFVFVTGDALNTEKARWFEEQGLPCLTKPFEPDAVRWAVARVLTAGPEQRR
ncbi:MAG TPA: ATP-binding protein [Candidatus Binatia bacterium]|nr:ATP-binding protein [Candidatus Binatia bacterium]